MLKGPVLDACAAPGGKAAALADIAPGAKPFVAADASPARIRKAVSTLDRTDSGALVVVMDALRPAIRSARTVLLDVPCSGTGVLRRRPDARWRLSERRLESLLVLQAELLDACADVLEPGGLLVYATCSLEAEENQGQVEAFLARRPEFDREPPGSSVGLVADCVTDRGDLEIFPSRTGDGRCFREPTQERRQGMTYRRRRGLGGGRAPRGGTTTDGGIDGASSEETRSPRNISHRAVRSPVVGLGVAGSRGPSPWRS